MKYSAQEVMQYISEEDVKFIRLAFCDVYGNQKNISVMPGELERAFRYGISFDASAIHGFGSEVYSDLLLFPDSSTITVLPWRPEHGRVVRMFCDIRYPDGKPFEADTRYLLKKAVEEAEKEGYQFAFGPEMEFYLLKNDENGRPTKEPFDEAGYMDIAPADKGENVRREICLTLEQMGVTPESSHHEEGPGQNEIDFRYSDALSSADNAITFRAAVRTIAARNGLTAEFSPKPFPELPGSGMHINFSVKGRGEDALLPHAIAGILKYAPDMTAFLNPCDESYRRLGAFKAPKYISWSAENRSPLIRIPAAVGEYRRAELRSPDPMANPYLAYTLLIYAGLEGIRDKLYPPCPANINFFTASEKEREPYECLPSTRKEAVDVASKSDFIRRILPDMLMKAYCEIL